jgi:ribosomal protein L34E
MAIPKTDHVITISDVPEEPWYQCCPICALMDIIESGQGNGTIHAFDNTGLQPIHIVIGDGKIKTMTPPGTILLVGGSCLTNKIFSTRTNAMAFIEKNPWAKPIMLKPVKETHALLKNKAQAINRCAMCANPLQGHEKTMMTLITKGEKRLQACCAHCGLFMAYKLKNNLIRAVIPDFKTGRLIDAQKAYYVVDNDLVVCCFPSTLSFAKRVDAQAFQKEHKGVMMTFEEALANMSKVMGK